MYEMTIRFEADGAGCLYEQIYEHIRLEIKEGKLLAGERLPSTRSLAEYLQVSRSTVDYAYQQLLSEGYIEARPYKGHFVCEMEKPFMAGEAKAQEVCEEAESGRDYGTDSGMDGRTSSILYDFNPNGIDMSGFPFGVWKKITKNILNDSNSDLFSQGEAQGDYDLRLTICRYLHSSRAVNCRPEQIVVGAGNDYLLLLLEKILGRHVKIAMENPTYKRAYQIFQSFAYEISTVNMDENGMLVSELEGKEVTAVYVMPSHQFPTGEVMPIGRRMELLKWAGEAPERYLIEDDYDSEFRYRGKPIPSLQSSDEQGKVIYMGTFSKAIAPAIRVSYMVLPEILLERFRRECFFYSSTVSRIDQRILNEFIKDGYFERHLNKMRKLYRIKHELLLEELQPFKKFFHISGDHAGLHLVLTGKKGQKEEELIEKAEKLGVRVYGLSQNMVETDGAEAGRESAGTVLLGYGGLSLEQIQEGITLLKKAWM